MVCLHDCFCYHWCNFKCRKSRTVGLSLLCIPQIKETIQNSNLSSSRISDMQRNFFCTCFLHDFAFQCMHHYEWQSIHLKHNQWKLNFFVISKSLLGLHKHSLHQRLFIRYRCKIQVRSYGVVLLRCRKLYPFLYE